MWFLWLMFFGAWCVEEEGLEVDILHHPVPSVWQHLQEDLGISKTAVWSFPEDEPTCTVDAWGDVFRMAEDYVYVSSGGQSFGSRIVHDVEDNSGEILHFSVWPFDPAVTPKELCAVAYDQNNDAPGGCVTLKELLTQEETVCSYVNGALTPSSVFCEYRAHPNGFSFTRFLLEYTNNIRFFVRVRLVFHNLCQIVVEWGVKGPECAQGDADEYVQGSKELKFVFADGVAVVSE